jgi:hypothetical protein
MSPGEKALARHLRAAGIEYTQEFRFAAESVGGPGEGVRERLATYGLKDWRSDFLIPQIDLLVEIEGGGWLKKGRHTTGEGFEEDMRKYDAAMRIGYNVYRCSPEMVKNKMAIKTIQILIRSNSNGG